MVNERIDNEGFAARFSALVAARGISLSALQRRLVAQGDPVSMATLSYWRSGARHPDGAGSLSVVASIEEILGAHSGALLDHIHPIPRVGRISEPELTFGDRLLAQDVAETAAALGTVEQAALRDLSVSVIARVGASGELESASTRALLQATDGELTEVPLYGIAEAEDTETKTITDVVGARVDRSMRHPGGRVICHVFAFDEPIPPGSTTMLEYTEHYPAGFSETREIWHAVDRPSRQTLIWVQFTAGAEPDWCEEFIETDGTETARMLPIRGGSVHVARFGFGPGSVGVRWGFDDD